MSYILDALKKSEQERKRGDVPGLQTTHIPLSVEQKTPLSLYGFILLLLVLLAFVIGVLVAERYPAGVNSTVSVVAPENQGGSQQASEVVVKHLATVAASSEPLPAVQYSGSQEQVAVVREEPTAPSQPASHHALPGVELSEIPYLHQLPDFRQQEIPELRFAGHVYSSSSLNRTVIINGVTMSEGESIMEGMSVEQITPSGVVLSFQGELFRVDILQDWSFE